MSLEKLFSRLREIETAIVEANSQISSLQGHKSEVLHWIDFFKTKSVEDEKKVEPEAEPVVE